jgi:hypothetical protein
MAETLGRVECLNIGNDFAFVGIREDVTNEFEAFIVYFSPSLPNATLRLMHVKWLSLLRDSFSSGSQVRIIHGNSSAFIDSLQLNKTV